MSRRMHRIKRLLAIVLIVVLALPANIMLQNYQVVAAQKPILSNTKVSLYLNQNAVLSNQKAVTLKVLNLPAQWNEKWKITFQSENKAIAAVSEEGIITARNVGNTKVICTVVNKKTNKSIYTYTCAVTVKENAKSVSIENLPKDNLMAIGVPQDFNARLKSSTGAKATDNTEWIISDNTAGAKVNDAGVVTALKAGTFTLTAKTYPDKVLLKNLGSKAYTAVSKAVIIRVLGDDIVSGEQIVNGTYSYENKKIGNLIIKKSVGDSKINLNKVHIAGKLILENNAGYMITVKDSYINQTETQKTSEDSAKSNPFEKFIQIGVIKVNAAGEEKTPELIVGDGSTISIINVGGTISIKQEGTANITSIQVTANASGEVEVKLAGFNGNLVVDTGAGTSTTVTTTECNITTATIMGNSSDKKVELRDTNAGTDRASSIGTVKVSSAAEIVLDVKTEVLTVSSQAVKAAVTVSQPVSVLQNSGAESKLVISAEVKSINSEGEKAQIQVERNGKVENVTTSGNSTEISGEGQVVTAVVTGDNTSVNTGGTKVEVKEEVKGVKVGNEEIKGGSTTVSIVTPSPTATPTQSPVAVIPTNIPTTAPTTVPTTVPTTAPTVTPTTTPTAVPTATPTTTPTAVPTATPTATPTVTPTAVPTIPLDPEAKEKEIYSQCKPLLDKALSIWSEDYENRFDETNKGPQDSETKAKTLYLTVKSLIDKLNLIDSTILSDAIEPVSELKNISDTDQVLTYNILMHRRMGSFAAEDVLKDDGTSIYTLDDYYIADTKAYSLYNAKQVRNGAYLLAAYYEAINESVPNFRDGKIHTAILDVLDTFQELKTEEYKNTDSWWSIKADDFSKLKEKLTALYLLEDASVIPNFNEEGQKDTAYYKNILTAGDNNFYRRLAEPLLYDLNTDAAPPAFSLKKYYDNKSTMSEYYETYGDWYVLGNINYNMIEAEKDNKNLQVKNSHVKDAAQLLLDDTVTLEKKKAALLQIIEDQEFNEYNTYDIWYKTGEIDEDGNDIWGVVKQGIYQKDELESIINNPEYLPYIVNAIRSDISDPGNNKANDYNPLHAILFYNEISTDVLKYHTNYQIAEDAKWSLLYRIVSEAYFREATLKEAVDNIIETLKTETSAEEDGVDIIGSVYDRKLDKESGEYYNEVKKGFQIIADDMSYTEDEQEALREVKDNDTYYKVLIKTLAQTMYFDSASDIYKIAGQSDATIEMYWRAFHEIYQTWLQVRELTNSKVFTAVDELIAAVKSNMEIKTGRDDATNETYSYTALKDNASIDDIQNAVEKLEKSYSVSSDDMYNAHREASADISEEDPGYDIQDQSLNNNVLKEITGNSYYILKIAENLAWNCLYEEPNPENQSCLYKIAHATTEEPVSSVEFYNYYSGAIYDVYCNVMNAYYDKAYETFLCLRQLTGSVKAAVSGSSLEVTEEGDKLDRIGDSLWRTLDLKYHSDWQDSEMTRDDIGLYMTRENIRLITADILKEGYVSPSESGSISWKNINLNTFSTEKEDITHYYDSILEVLNSLHTVLMSQKEDFEPNIQALVSEIKQNFYLDNENSVAPSSVADYDGIKEKLKSFWALYYHRTEENADFMSFLENDIYLRDYALRVAYNIYRPQDNMDLQVVANEIEIPDNANDRRNLFQNVGNWLLEDIKDIQANGSDEINFTKAQIITLAMQVTEATVVSGGSIELNTETPGTIDSIKETLNGLIDRFHFTSLDSNKLPSEVEGDSIAGFLKNILSNEEQDYIERIILALGSRIKLPEGISDGSDFAKIALEDSSITDITYSNAFWDIINTIIRVYVLK